MQTGSDRMSESRSEAHEAAAASRNESADCQESSRERRGAASHPVEAPFLPFHTICYHVGAPLLSGDGLGVRHAHPLQEAEGGVGAHGVVLLIAWREREEKCFIYLFIHLIFDWFQQVEMLNTLHFLPASLGGPAGEANNTVLYCHSTTTAHNHHPVYICTVSLFAFLRDALRGMSSVFLLHFFVTHESKERANQLCV